MASEDSQIYHERQTLQFCLLHSLNNLFQQKDAFRRRSLNEIADNLVLDETEKKTWTPLSGLFKPHRNTLTGNYDINVLIAAVEGKEKTVIWHDRRNGASSIDLDGPEDALMGIVLNIPVKRWGGIWSSRHWVAIRKINGRWYNLDSDLVAPKAFEDAEQVKGFLDSMIGHGGEVLLVMNEYSGIVARLRLLEIQKKSRCLLEFMIGHGGEVLLVMNDTEQVKRLIGFHDGGHGGEILLVMNDQQ